MARRRGIPAREETWTDQIDRLRLFERPVILWPHGDTYTAEEHKGIRRREPERLVVDFYFAVTRRGLPYPRNDLAVVVARFLAEYDVVT